MILAVDIGNTDIVFGVKKTDWITHRVKTNREKSTSFYKTKIDTWLSPLANDTIDRVVVSSVVPQLTPIILEALADVSEKPTILVGSTAYDQLPITIENKNEIGTDLVCNALASFELFKSDCMVIDFGTALTFTVIIDQKIVGVNIAPGIKTALSSLTKSAAQLNDIPLALPASVIGKDTTSALQAGILWGYVGLVERMIERIEHETGKSFKIAATGGLSHVLEPLKAQFDVVDKNLTLEGLSLIARYFDQTNSSPK